jgi:hypothetical protein
MIIWVYSETSSLDSRQPHDNPKSATYHLPKGRVSDRQSRSQIAEIMSDDFDLRGPLCEQQEKAVKFLMSTLERRGKVPPPSPAAFPADLAAAKSREKIHNDW